MDLVDLHQKLGNNSQIQGILCSVMKRGTHILDLVNDSMNEKLTSNLQKSKEKLSSLINIFSET